MERKTRSEEVYFNNLLCTSSLDNQKVQKGEEAELWQLRRCRSGRFNSAKFRPKILSQYIRDEKSTYHQQMRQNNPKWSSG